jgi:hypothetical protein
VESSEFIREAFQRLPVGDKARREREEIAIHVSSLFLGLDNQLCDADDDSEVHITLAQLDRLIAEGNAKTTDFSANPKR